METPLEIDHYTDVLCVWAWIAQRRVEELEQHWGRKIHINHHCVNVFGDTVSRIGRGWSDRGGYDGFAKHVAESAEPYETAPVNPDVWRRVRPFSSAGAHLVLKAVEICSSPEEGRKFADSLRRRFFLDAVDIGNIGACLAAAGSEGHKVEKLSAVMDSGQAHGALAADYELARTHGIKGSPSWVLNQGRQVLYGNVGYRVLNANIEELIKSPVHEASWC
jgi:predicted DsbA family dithiol-disulfide isomerase